MCNVASLCGSVSGCPTGAKQIRRRPYCLAVGTRRATMMGAYTHPGRAPIVSLLSATMQKTIDKSHGHPEWHPILPFSLFTLRHLLVRAVVRRASHSTLSPCLLRPKRPLTPLLSTSRRTSTPQTLSMCHPRHPQPLPLQNAHHPSRRFAYSSLWSLGVISISSYFPPSLPPFSPEASLLS